MAYETLARQGTAAEDPNRSGVHGTAGRNPYTTWIATYNGAESNILQIAPKTWGAVASRLSDLVANGHPDKKGKPRVALSANERRRIHAWIDLNVPYYGTASSNHLERKGCRQILPPDLERTLARVASSRCHSCHKPTKTGGGIPRTFYVRITNPENNNFLLAPLARTAGGAERCGVPVFKTKKDPDYQAILATFAPVEKLIRKQPRMDMDEDIYPPE